MRNITDLQGTFELNNGVQMPYFGLGVYLSQRWEMKWSMQLKKH